MSKAPLRPESPRGWIRNTFGRREKKSNKTTPDHSDGRSSIQPGSDRAGTGGEHSGKTKDAQGNNSESDEERRRWVEQLVLNALDDKKGTDSLSLLQDAADGQLAMNEVWKLLFQSAASANGGGDHSDHQENLKCLLLNLVIRFCTFPVGPVFTEIVRICPDPSRHSQTDLKSAQPKLRDPEVQARSQSFLAAALQQDHADDSTIALLLKDADGQDVIDECWDMLASGDRQDDERDKIRRLCLKLVLRLSTVPAAMELPDVRYLENNPLGSGSFAEVFRGEYQGNVVAVKRLREFTKMTDVQRQDMLRSLYREAFLWKLLDHQYILPLFGVSTVGQQGGVVTLVSPLAVNGGIRDHIRELQSKSTLPTSGPEFMAFVYHLLHQVSIGLAYLHKQGIVHGDLHCGNILINDAGDIQLTDFGLALIANATSYNYASIHGGGAVFTRAPELLDPMAVTTRPTTACDVYAFAFLCIELLTGQRAFPEVPEIQVPGLILKGERPSRPHQLADNATHNAMWSLIMACWRKHPDFRPLADHVSGLVETIVDYACGKAPTFSCQMIWRRDPSSDGTDYNLACAHDYLACLQGHDITICSAATGESLHVFDQPTFDFGETIQAVCTKQVLVCLRHRFRSVEIWSLVSGKCLYRFRSLSYLMHMSVSFPEVLDTVDGEVDGARDPSRNLHIVLFDERDIFVLAFPPLHHQLDSPEVQENFVSDSPFLKHRLPRTCRGFVQRLLEHNCVAVQENIAVSSFEDNLEVWDIVAGKQKWVARGEPGDKDMDVKDLFLNIAQGVVVASYGTSARIWDIHTGDVLHNLSPNGLARTWCQQSGSSVLCLTKENTLSIWDPLSSSPVRTLLTLHTPPLDDTRPVFVHNGNHVLWAGNHGIDLLNIHSGLTVGSFRLPFGKHTDIRSLYLEEQLFVVALLTPGRAYRIAMWRFSDSSVARTNSESFGHGTWERWCPRGRSVRD